MNININVLMIILLIVLIASFAILIIYGEIWRIDLVWSDSHIERTDHERAQIAFIASCVCIASGASMLYIMETQFSQNEKVSSKTEHTTTTILIHS